MFYVYTSTIKTNFRNFPKRTQNLKSVKTTDGPRLTQDRVGGEPDKRWSKSLDQEEVGNTQGHRQGKQKLRRKGKERYT